uniref:Coenzyme PQQ synthesis protein D (PqqD) n=1 Tax=Candidatus Kentrum sp. FW TaxID=2126338 RepID=A0A450TKJ1_9GAMM|nr:MAG: Coenzyme PQQ synthesis protein D (PqqD) [Candidatus Kentron sp. FW]
MTNNPIARLAINEEGFVFDPQTGAGFTVNETGRAILGMLKEPGKGPGDKAREESIALGLTDRFEVPYGKALADACDFIQQLRLHRLL